MDIVTVHNLKKYFGKGDSLVKALDGIDLAIEKGNSPPSSGRLALVRPRC